MLGMRVVNKLLIAFVMLLSSSAALGAADELGYSPDGGLVSFGEFDYVYDSASDAHVRVRWMPAHGRAHRAEQRHVGAD